MQTNASPTHRRATLALPSRAARLVCAFFLSAIPLTVTAAWAQKTAPAKPSNTQPATQPATPTLLPGPMSQLKSMEPAANEEYQLGGGDELTLEFVGRPEISGKHIVGPDGRITLPSAGAVTVSGLTREQAGGAIDKAMSAFYTNVSCIVRIDKYGSNRVLVLGYVEHPGIMYFDQTPTLLEAITRAGMLRPTGARQVDDTVPDRVAIYRGNDQAIWVDVQGLLAAGNPMADMRLRRNDTIFVPNDQDRIISVLGEVNHPGAIQLRHNSTLPSLIAEAGGITEKAGENPQLSIVDPVTQKTRTIRYHDLLTPTGALEVTLKPGEVVYVPRGGLAKTGYVLQQLSPLTTALTFGAAFH